MNIQKPNVGMLPQERIAYSPIVNRKPLVLPNKAKMVVWVVTNVEDWDPTQTMPRRKRFPDNSSFRLTSISFSRLACALATTKPTSVAIAPMSAT